MDAFDSVALSHEHLQSDKLQNQNQNQWKLLFTLSNAVEHERGWVARKMGLLDMSKANDGEIQQEDLRDVAKDILKATCAQLYGNPQNFAWEQITSIG